MQKKVIQYYRRDVFGNPRCYIVNPLDAAHVQKLTGKLTVDESTMQTLRRLTDGFLTFEQVLPPQSP